MNLHTFLCRYINIFEYGGGSPRPCPKIYLIYGIFTMFLLQNVKILNSETHWAMGLSYKGLWTCANT